MEEKHCADINSRQTSLVIPMGMAWREEVGREDIHVQMSGIEETNS